MEWLNYHHLHYFWVVARTGSVRRACAELHVSQPTVSGQIQKLEETLGAPLFARAGRGLTMTDTGRVVFSYADEIFSLGAQMMDDLRGRRRGRRLPFVVGVADVVPKLVAHRLLSVLRDLPLQLQLTCREDSTTRLLAELSAHAVDVVIADIALPPSASVRAFSHLLGECGVLLCAAPALAARHRAEGALQGAPFLLPAEGSQIRTSLDQWFREREISIDITGVFDDSALLKVFGGAGAGLFAVPDVIEEEVCRQYDVEVVARIPEIRERFYAISIERRIKHPAIAAIAAAARKKVFG
jgi:LysR family transcriptional activator of nhaA